jgi:hypothetical protein
MRHIFPLTAAVALTLIILSGLTAQADETLDPSQVRMLPDNPYQKLQPVAESPPAIKS